MGADSSGKKVKLKPSIGLATRKTRASVSSLQGECSKESSPNDSRCSQIFCFCCEVKYEVEDVGLTAESSEFIEANKSDGVVWCCESCLSNKRQSKADLVKVLLEKFDELQNQVAVMKNNFDSKLLEIQNQTNAIPLQLQKQNEIQISNKLNDFNKVISEKIDLFEEKISSKVKAKAESIIGEEQIKTYSKAVSNGTEQVKQTKEDIISINTDPQELEKNLNYKKVNEKEQAERLLREKNVVVFNLPENDCELEAEYKEDIEKLKKVFKNKIEINKEDIKAIYRLGEKNPAKTRPILIKLETLEVRNELLKLRNLKIEETKEDEKGTKNMMSIIYISPDRTKQQQQENRLLVNEMKARKNKGEEICIRNGKIASTTPFRRDPQSYWG